MGFWHGDGEWVSGMVMGEWVSGMVMGNGFLAW